MSILKLESVKSVKDFFINAKANVKYSDTDKKVDLDKKTLEESEVVEQTLLRSVTFYTNMSLYCNTKHTKTLLEIAVNGGSLNSSDTGIKELIVDLGIQKVSTEKTEQGFIWADVLALAAYKLKMRQKPTKGLFIRKYGGTTTYLTVGSEKIIEYDGTEDTKKLFAEMSACYQRQAIQKFRNKPNVAGIAVQAVKRIYAITKLEIIKKDYDFLLKILPGLDHEIARHNRLARRKDDRLVKSFKTASEPLCKITRHESELLTENERNLLTKRIDMFSELVMDKDVESFSILKNELEKSKHKKRVKDDED